MVGQREHMASGDSDQGFTLIEVVVALMLMTVVLLSGGGFMIRAISSSSELAGRQGAVTVANEVLEQIRAVRAMRVSGVSPLVYARPQAASAAQWTAAAAAGLDVTNTYTGGGGTAFDALAYSSTGSQTVPFQQIINRGVQAYTVDALIGVCVRVSASAECDKSTVGAQMYRAVVRVTWIPGVGKKCSGNICSFVTSTLIDPTTEPIFNANRKPVANNDPLTGALAVVSGTPTDIGVTVNDTGDLPILGAVTLITTPAHGTAVLSATSNIVTYTPTVGYSGTDSFTYVVTDTGGRTSTAGTVNVTVTPLAVADTVSVAAGSTTPVSAAVLTNDRGTGLSLVSVATPSAGTATISANNVLYTPSATTTGTVTVTYTAKDSANQQYTGTLTVTVRPGVTATGTCWPGWSNGPAQTRSLVLPTSAFIGTPGFTIGSAARVAPFPAASTVSASGTTLNYFLPASSTVPQSISYVVTDGTGATSPVVTMTLKGVCP